jgi:D-galacturonate reductase
MSESNKEVMPVNVLMIGTGEYTTGYVNGMPSDSDKSAGVVGITMCDLRERNKVGRIGMCGVNGKKFPEIRAHQIAAITNVYSGLDVTMDTFPNDDTVDPLSYIVALDSFKRGDAVTIFTPDDTHFDITMAAIVRGLHVLVTKPAVKTLEHHQMLHEAAVRNNVIVCVEVHKRYDQIYGDARDKIQGLGPFSYLYSYMSQPKHQLDTFRAWAGKSSDISYYLNSHHIDFHEWAVGETSRPIAVTAIASKGLALSKFDIDCEDTITLTVQWENIETSDGSVNAKGLGTAVYTSSWIAPKSDVHSQQRFFYMGHKGEVTVDQAHRGYNIAVDGDGYRSVNPLFMKYTPSDGKFAGQLGYGYRSFEYFIDAVAQVNAGNKVASDYDHVLASIATTYRTSAILEAGRVSLDTNRTVEIGYSNSSNPCRPTNLAARS